MNNKVRLGFTFVVVLACIISISLAKANPPKAWYIEDNENHFVKSVSSWDVGPLWRAERNHVDYAHHYAERALDLVNTYYSLENRSISETFTKKMKSELAESTTRKARRCFENALRHDTSAKIFPNSHNCKINTDALNTLKENFYKDLHRKKCCGLCGYITTTTGILAAGVVAAAKFGSEHPDKVLILFDTAKNLTSSIY